MEAGKIEVNGKKVTLLERHKKNPDYKTVKQQVFIVGSKGIPAAYGGFETFVEKLTEYQVSDKIRYHVSRIADDSVRYDYNGAKCFNVNVPDVGAAKAVFYDVAALHACINYCKARPSIQNPIFYVLACRIGPFIGLMKREIRKIGGSLYVNPDGHEWKRGKWSAPIQKYWKISEAGMVKHADLLICDSVNIEKYIQEEYKKYNPKTTYIAYGSDTLPSLLDDKNEKYISWLNENGLKSKRYYLIVGRFVPENNFETMIYKSPTGWMFVLNYHKIECCLKNALEILDCYRDYVCNLDTIRLCLTYNNFNYAHIMMKEGKLISFDHIKINLCIYDIYNMYQKIPELIFDFDVILDSYFCKLKLLKEEKLLLRCLLHVVPIIKLEHDEINNIIVMSRLLYYLDSISSLNKKLSID